MKKFIIYFFLFYLFARKVVGIAQAQDKNDEVILTEQAQLIFDTTIHDWKDSNVWHRTFTSKREPRVC